MYTFTELLKKANEHIGQLQFTRQPAGLYDPIAYVLSLGGKRVRPVLMLMAYNLYRDDVDAIMGPAVGVEVYHNYTLLHDDLMDRADRRRGQLTVHKKWNDNVAILSGDAMLVLAYQYMAQAPAHCLKEILDLFSITALEICEGQQMDMEFEQRSDVTEEEYLEMIRLKTSVLLASSLKIGALLGGASREDAQCLYDFGIHAGLAFQLKDDYLDVYGNPELFGKNIGGDILCNKKTYMLIQALAHPDRQLHAELQGWLDKADAAQTCPEQKIAAVTQLYDRMGIDALCEQKMAFYNDLAANDLEKLSVADDRKVELRQLLARMAHREM